MAKAALLVLFYTKKPQFWFQFQLPQQYF